jgi:mono/diheme cytochrome c family protein
MTVPLTARIGALVLASTAFYTYVGQMVPQSEVHPPAEIALKADLTTADMVKVGREIMESKGLCFTCHTIGKTGALRFPDLEGVDVRAKSRVPGLSDVEYFAQSMYEPDAYIVQGFNPGMPVINKPPIGLTDQEILCVIAYLQTLGGTPTVTLQSTHRFLSGAPGVAPAPAAPKKGTLLRPAGASPVAVRTASAIGTLHPVAAHQAAARLVRGPRRAFFARWGGGGGGVPR